MRTRVIIEQAFGQLKRRFYILGSEIRLNYTSAPRVITCCAMLHNFAIRRNMPDFDYHGDELGNENDLHINHMFENGLLYRDFVANNFF